MRLLLAATLALTLAACSPNLTPDEAAEAAAEAVEAGDAGEALRLYRSAAKRGHLRAMETLADAHRRGYFTRSGSMVTGFNPVRFVGLPWEASHWQRRFEDEMTRQVRAGSTEARYMLAGHLRTRHFDGETWHDPSPAERDSSEAIYHALANEGHVNAMLVLSFRANSRGDSLVADRWLARAEEAGSETACWFRVSRAHRHLTSMKALADGIDAGTRCEAMEDDPSPIRSMAEMALGNLFTQDSLGNEAATAALDSLRALGVFERHPHLAPSQAPVAG